MKNWTWIGEQFAQEFAVLLPCSRLQSEICQHILTGWYFFYKFHHVLYINNSIKKRATLIKLWIVIDGSIVSVTYTFSNIATSSMLSKSIRNTKCYRLASPRPHTRHETVSESISGPSSDTIDRHYNYIGNNLSQHERGHEASSYPHY